MESLVSPAINLLILLVFLAVKLRQPIRQFAVDRHHSVAKELNEVRDQLRNAQEKFNEFAGKLKTLDAEIKVLKEQTRQEAIALKQRMDADAQKMSSTLLSDAKNSVNTLFAELKEQLYYDLMSRIVARTEKVMKDRLTGADKDRIRQEFSLQLEKIS